MIISRQRIANVDDYTITITDEHEKPKAKAKANPDLVNFINPFREPDFASESEAKKLGE